MSSIGYLYDSAELAQAAYADLSIGYTNTIGNMASLKDADDGAGMTAKQAESFARRYPTVVAQYNDTETSFSATVFKDIDGNLTLAIKGTSEYGDFVPTDTNIFLQGAGYDQIVAMYNWWKRVSTPQGQMVEQYELRSFLVLTDPVPDKYTLLYRTSTGGAVCLARSDSVAASGELVDDLQKDSNQHLTVTGHSLGGHLSMAFGALFPEVTDQINVFNAPGFRTTTENEAFFTRLSGTIPAGVATTNIIANEAVGNNAAWDATAGLHSRPGSAVDIVIEDQSPNVIDNHSIKHLVDSLAVCNLLATIDPSISIDKLTPVISAASNVSDKTLERIIYSLSDLFLGEPIVVDTDNRDQLYAAIHKIEEKLFDDRTVANPQLKEEYWGLRIIPFVRPDAAGPEQFTQTGLVKLAHTDVGYRYAITHLNPFAIIGSRELYEQHNKEGQLAIELIFDRWGMAA